MELSLSVTNIARASWVRLQHICCFSVCTSACYFACSIYLYGQGIVGTYAIRNISTQGLWIGGGIGLFYFAGRNRFSMVLFISILSYLVNFLVNNFAGLRQHGFSSGDPSHDHNFYAVILPSQLLALAIAVYLSAKCWKKLTSFVLNPQRKQCSAT